MDYELISHTADIGIRLKAGTLKGLFLKAARAAFDVMAEAKKPLGALSAREFSIALKAPNIQELFVRWLSELVSLSDAKDVHFTRFDIKDFSETTLTAAAFGLPREHFQGKIEIKAVTYHALKVEKKGNGFEAEVIFDV